MLTKLSDKTDKFHFIVLAVMLMLGILIFISINTVLDSRAALRNSEQEVAEEAGIDEVALDEAYEFLQRNEPIPLDL